MKGIGFVKTVVPIVFPLKLKDKRDPVSSFTFNHALDSGNSKELILVDNYSHFFRIWEAGYENVAVLQDHTLSDIKAEIICNFVGPKGRITLILATQKDAEKIGRDVVEKLMLHLYVRLVILEAEGIKPDELTEDNIKRILTA